MLTKRVYARDLKPGDLVCYSRTTYLIVSVRSNVRGVVGRRGMYIMFVASASASIDGPAWYDSLELFELVKT